MRKYALVVLGCCLLLSGCGKSAMRTSLQGLLTVVNELSDVLATVKDKASAEAARPKLDALAQRMKTLGEAMPNLNTASKDDQEWMQKEFTPQMKAASEKLSKTIQNVKDPETQKKAGEIMMEWMSTALKKVQPGS